MALSIGKKIQGKRKAMGFTQEQLAGALGVSIAAVSKWETGGAYPDITLLSPLARLLGSTVDDLLGFEPQLSAEQVMEICEECAEAFENVSCESAEELGEKYLKEYPSSPLLKLRLGSVFMMHTPCAETEEAAGRLTDRAAALMREASDSDDTTIRETAWQNLCALLMMKERYEDALQTLEQIHQPVSDPVAMKVSVYLAMGDLEKSKQAAQYLLASHLGACDIALATLANIAQKEKNDSLALRMEELNLRLSRMFDRDKLCGHDLNHYLMIAQCHAKRGNAQETLDALHGFAACVQMPDSADALKSSPFFDRIEIHSSGMSKAYLKRCICLMVKENPRFAFLAGNPEFTGIVHELEQLSEPSLPEAGGPTP